jgi:thiol-disulfide isomerase/thioredoxin
MKSSSLLVWVCFCALTALADTPSADQLLSEAKANAHAEHKVIFVHFGASWCVWCKRLESWLARPDAKPAFEKYFIPLKLVVQEKGPDKKLENKGGDKVLQHVGGKDAGIPFMAFVDENGNLIVNSIRPFGKLSQNIGYPGALAEIDFFLKMIKTAAPGITPADLKQIEDSLNAANKSS